MLKPTPRLFLEIRARASPIVFSTSPMAPQKSAAAALAEYAKSGRSSCKGCGKAIAAGALRLGLVSRDPRGFDATKWHHLDCFPADSQPQAVEDIQGFSSLQSADQEALRGLESGQTVKEDHKRDGSETEEPEDKSPKKPKVGKGKEESKKESKKRNKEEPEKVIAEYAKSSRSSCKSCGKTISLGCLRLGLVSKDPRGFEMTKWHHSECVQSLSKLVGSVEKIQGFSSLKSYDQEALRKLESLEPSSQGSGEFCKVDDAGIEVEDKGIKKPKLSEEDKMEGLTIAFSVSDIKTSYKDATLSPKWKAFQTVIFREREDGLHDSEKIAAFDFDGCLVNTSVKRVGPDAWSLMYPSIPEKLRGLYDSGYKLVIFTNESNIERWKNKRQQAVDSKIGRLDNFINLVKVPIQVFIACGLEKSKDQFEDPFRKPKPGMWRLMEDHFNSGIVIDMDQSFYVGDAAGRAKDHGDADVKFARAIGMKFHVPEEYFAA